MRQNGKRVLNCNVKDSENLVSFVNSDFISKKRPLNSIKWVLTVSETYKFRIQCYWSLKQIVHIFSDRI
jgi:hypothetical protein